MISGYFDSSDQKMTLTMKAASSIVELKGYGITESCRILE
jgi:hypothetical protein